MSLLPRFLFLTSSSAVQTLDSFSISVTTTLIDIQFTFTTNITVTIDIYIAIPQRLDSFSRNAHLYRKKRVQWGIFNRWLKLLERESLDSTVGLVHTLVERRRRHQGYSQYLALHGFECVACVGSERLRKTEVSTEGTYALRFTSLEVDIWKAHSANAVFSM
jgi:hypothetical protein